MRCRLMFLIYSAVALLTIGAPIPDLLAGDSSQAKPIPSVSEVRLTVSRYFAARDDFQPGDLITKKDVAPLLAQLRQQWLPAADASRILERTPAEGEFLVDQLSTANGRKFMRRIAKYPDAYDRLDRLSRMPYGRQTVRDLIRGPGGEKMIEYMTTTAGGEELGTQLSNTPDGKRFNAPTGRIYTVAILLDRLQQSRTAAAKAGAERVTRRCQEAAPVADEPKRCCGVLVASRNRTRSF